MRVSEQNCCFARETSCLLTFLSPLSLWLLALSCDLNEARNMSMNIVLFMSGLYINQPRNERI